jgi:hypothetical protein
MVSIRPAGDQYFHFQEQVFSHTGPVLSQPGLLLAHPEPVLSGPVFYQKMVCYNFMPELFQLLIKV